MTPRWNWSARALTLPAILLLAGSGRATAAVAPWTVDSYKLEITLEPGEQRMEGLAVMALRAAAQPAGLPVFYLHGELRVESVEGPEGPLPFRTEPVLYRGDYSLVARRITLDPVDSALPGPVRVRYGGHFHPSGARSPSDYMRIDASGAYLRSYGYSLWFPVFLEASSGAPRVSFTSVRIRTPRELLPVFVGERVSEEVKGDRRITLWRATDVDLFAAQLSARPYVLQKFGGFHVYSLHGGEDRAAGRKIGRLASRLVERFAARYRRQLPSGQFHIAQLPRYGDISSGNMIGMASGTWREFGREEWPVRTLAHEIVHPFVSIPTPPGSPLRALVIEAFPSYFHLPVLAELRGEELYTRYMDRVQTAYLARRSSGQDRRGRPLPPERPLLEIEEEEIGRYKDRFVLADRALLFLDHLRRSMGPEAFFSFAASLLRQTELTPEKLYALIEDHLPGGRRIARTWLETSAYPERFRRP